MNNYQQKSDTDRFNSLLMGAVDGELTKQERIEFEQLVSKYPEYKSEWQNYQKIKEVTKDMKFKEPKGEVWDKYWVNIYNRIERGIGWIIFSVGCMILITYGLFKAVESIIADPQLETIIKVGIIAVIAGTVILLVSVLRERLFVRKTDQYAKEVER